MKYVLLIYIIGFIIDLIAFKYYDKTRNVYWDTDKKIVYTINALLWPIINGILIYTYIKVKIKLWFNK